MAWQLRDEIDRLWTFKRCEMRTTVVDKLGLDLRKTVGCLHQLHDGFDLLTKVFVRYAENGRIHDLRVVDEKIFRFLRVDVHATRDDDERFSIEKV
jgi:hypothetical protein